MFDPDSPAIGRLVLYRSRTGIYTVPAIVTATTYTLNPKGVEAGAIPALSSDLHVHLLVFTPGTPGKRIGAGDFVDGSDRPVAENVGGVYQEWDVPPCPKGPEDGGDNVVPLRSGYYGVENDEFAPGTYAWPVRV